MNQAIRIGLCGLVTVLSVCPLAALAANKNAGSACVPPTEDRSILPIDSESGSGAEAALTAYGDETALPTVRRARRTSGSSGLPRGLRRRWRTWIPGDANLEHRYDANLDPPGPSCKTR